MQDALTAVVSLFLVLHTAKDTIDHRCHRIAVYVRPAAVIRAVMRIQFLVVNMLRRHMAFIGNVQRELLVGTGVFAE